MPLRDAMLAWSDERKVYDLNKEIEIGPDDFLGENHYPNKFVYLLDIHDDLGDD